MRIENLSIELMCVGSMASEVCCGMRDADHCEESLRDYAMPSSSALPWPCHCQTPCENELHVVCRHQWGARVGLRWIADARAETGLVGRCRVNRRKGRNLLSERLSHTGMYYISFTPRFILSG